MNRQQKLEKIFYELKAATFDASACVQNDAPNDVLIDQLVQAQSTVSNAFNKAWRDLINLGPDNEV